MITNITIHNTAYWGQTGVWLGLIVDCLIPPQGDAKPNINQGVVSPNERAYPAVNQKPPISEPPINQQ